MIISPRPPIHQLLKTILSWPVIHLVVPTGVSHISLRHKKYNRGSGRKRTKNKRTIWAWVNSSARRVVPWHYIPCESVDKRWHASFAKFPQSHEESWLTLTELLSPLLDSISCRLSLLLSGDDCPSASPFANCLLWVPFSNSLTNKKIVC